MRALTIALVCGAAFLAAATSTPAQDSRRPPFMSAATAADLIPKALIRRDTFGVPHIIAETDEAAAFAMGYAVAEDHAVEIGKLYLQARGDAARWFGPSHLDDDLAMKRMDNLEGARRALERTGEGYRRWLHGFVTGVNHYADTHRAELPEWFPTVTEADIIAFSRRGAVEGAVSVPQSPGEGDDGSNALAIAKTHSTTGAPILLGNPHLRWTAQYWEAHITVPGKINFYGSLTVGLAVLRAGFGENIGYVQTNNNVDLVDHYAVPLAAGRPDHYAFAGQSYPFRRQTVRVEVLQADGRIETVAREFEATHFGPVVSRTATHAVVSRSHALDAWHFHEGYYELYFAQNFESFMATLSRQMIPSSNFTYADGDGNIMYLWNAALPRRPASVSDAGEVSYAGVVPGDDDRYFWRGIVPLADVPRFLNPASGYVQNANNPPWFATVRERLDPKNFPPYMEQGAPGLRPQMALTMLESKQRWSPDDIVRLKYATDMLLPRRVLPDLFAAGAAVPSPSADLRTGLRILRSWDRKAAARSRGAVLFQNFWNIYAKNAKPLYREEWSDTRVIETPTGLGDPPAALAALAEAVALVRARHGAPDAAWGEVNRYRFPGIDLPGNGGPQGLGLYTAQNYDPPSPNDTAAAPVRNVAGRSDVGAPPSGGGDGWIVLVNFTKPVSARGVLAYGQSANADSPHSRDQIGIFARQELRPLWFTEAEVRKNLAREYRPGAPADDLVRSDRFVDSDAGVRIAVREVTGKTATGTPVLLVHDAGAGGLVSFDLPNASVAAELARAGHPVTIMSVRGWEKSTRPSALDGPANGVSPAVGVDEARRDIDAVVADLRARRNMAKVAVLGWGTGSTWAGAYAARHPDGVSHLVLLNPAARPDAQTCESAGAAAYRLADGRTLRARWDAATPAEDAAGWRDDLVVAGFVQRALRLDPSSDARTPASVRLPNGPLADSCAATPVWDPATVSAPTLIIRGDQPDIGRVHMPRAISLTIRGGSHYLLLEKPERGRRQFMTATLAFLRK